MIAKEVVCNREHTDCAAYRNGMCIILTDDDFGKKDCPFYKTNEQNRREIQECAERNSLKRKSTKGESENE